MSIFLSGGGGGGDGRPVSYTHLKGPPTHSPSSFFSLYLIARAISQYLVPQPIKAMSQIQNTAPGPPITTAAGTPTMLEAPMDDARAAQAAENGDTSPSPALANILPKVCVHMYPNFLN